MKKIKPFPFALFQAFLAGLVGLFAGILYSFGGLAIDTLVSFGWISSKIASTPGLSYGTILAFGALLGMPIIFASFGFVIGLLEAILYNAFTKGVFKVEVDFK